MKTLTCRAMGGDCDQKISANTPDEMIQNGMEHLEKNHPKMAADIKAAGRDDPKMVRWFEDFKKTWAATPDD